MSISNVKFTSTHLATFLELADFPFCLKGRQDRYMDPDVTKDLIDAGMLEAKDFLQASPGGLAFIADITANEGISQLGLKWLAFHHMYDEIEQGKMPRNSLSLSDQFVPGMNELSETRYVDQDNILNPSEDGMNLIDKYLGEFPRIDTVMEERATRKSRPAIYLR